MPASAVESVRRFNRVVAQRVGALDHHFLGRPRPMGESRVLWEIGLPGADVRELRSRLGLDSGYMSRVLRSLERQGLVLVGASPKDGRVRTVRLTKAGDVERAELDRRADQFAEGMLESLTSKQRTRLVAAMSEVERLLSAAFVRFGIEDPTTSEARWCIEQYFDELGRRFESGFDPSQSISADPHELIPPAGALMIARLHEKPIGCGALKFHGDEPAELKRMWIAAEARGLGLGRRLLLELEAYARGHGVRVVRLETNGSLREAIQLYRTSGYREVPAFNDEPYAHHWFEKRL